MKVKLLCNVLVPFAACLAIGGVRGSSIQKSDGGKKKCSILEHNCRSISMNIVSEL